MKARLTTTVFFAASLCCLLAGCAKPCPKNRLDITLAGPWLLYQDFQFDAWGKKVPVLIAIAPKGAGAATTDMGDKDKEDHHDSQYHHLPQISAGDGYYIQDAGVYCLYFDDKCAPKGPNSLRSAGYFQVATLPAAFHGENGKTIWDLIDPTKVVAVILPMPDSYSNAGVWKARFGTSLDTIRSGHSSEREISIGLQLHYANGPTEFYLRRCDVPATAENCRHKLNNINHTNLKNTGTLEVLMRAPDNISACDPHVRYAYKMVLDLLGPGYQPRYRNHRSRPVDECGWHRQLRSGSLQLSGSPGGQRRRQCPCYFRPKGHCCDANNIGGAHTPQLAWRHFTKSEWPS